MQTVVDGDLQRLALRLRTLIIISQMPSHVHQQAKAVLACDHQTVDRRVSDAGVRVLGDDDAVGKIGAAVFERMRRHRDAPEIDLGHRDLLRRRIVNDDGRHGVLMQRADSRGKQSRKRIHAAVKNRGNVLTVPPHASGYRIIIALHVLEHDRLAAVELRSYAGQLMHRIHFGVHIREPAGRVHFFEAIFQIHSYWSSFERWSPRQP